MFRTSTVNNRNVFRSTGSCCPFDSDLDYEPRPVDSASLGKTRPFVSLIGNSHSVKSRIGRASPLTSFFRGNSKEKRSVEILFFARSSRPRAQLENSITKIEGYQRVASSPWLHKTIFLRKLQTFSKSIPFIHITLESKRWVSIVIKIPHNIPIIQTKIDSPYVQLYTLRSLSESLSSITRAVQVIQFCPEKDRLAAPGHVTNENPREKRAATSQ